MAMAITMRMLARIFFFATEVTQGPLSSLHYAHIKRTPKSRCAICSGFEDTAKMSSRSRGTCPGDLAGDHFVAQPDSTVEWLLELVHYMGGCQSPSLQYNTDITGVI